MRKTMRKKQGFTLIELLATIAILAIIAVITVPIVLGMINEVRIAAYKQSLASIFKATNIYLADNKFAKVPDEGINVTDQSILIEHKDFTSGKIILNEQGKLELKRVSNGKYCGNGVLANIVVVEGDCDQLDITPPTIAINSNLVTSSSVAIVATSEDLESGISGYQFSKDNGVTWTSSQISNVYTFTGLSTDTYYIFKVKVSNNNNLTSVSDALNVRTISIGIPTYSVDTTDWSSSKIVTIMYPPRQPEYIYEYSLDNALTWQVAASPATTKNITFNANGNVIARIFDGTNEINGASYVVTNIDNSNPVITLNLVGTPFNVNGWAKANFNLNVQSSDNESGIDYYKYCQTTSATCSPTIVVNAVSGNVTISTESTTNKVCAQAIDNASNSSPVVCSSSYKLDKTIPTAGNINVTGTLGTNGWYKTNVTVNKTDGSDILSGHASTTLSHTAITSETIGTTVTLTTTDNAGNTAIRTQIVKIDKTNPEVVFSMNGNSTYVQSRATLVNVSDALSGVLNSSLKYLWNTSLTTPTEASFTSSFTNDQSISTPSGATGSYYLWILSKDNAGNTTITRSNVFNLDNTVPVITINPETISIYVGSTYVDNGVTANDSINGDITSNIIKTGSVNSNVIGTYILTYNVSDSSGNAAVTKTRTVIVQEEVIYYYSNPGGDTSSSAKQKELLRIPLSGATVGQALKLYRDYEFNNTRNTGHHALISPDSQYIYYYSNPGGDTSSSASQKELLRIPLSGATVGQAQVLYRDYAFNNTKNTGHHALMSPDGQYIYYYSNPGGDTSSSASQKELLRIPLSGATVGQAQLLYRDYAFNNTKNTGHHALMSPDGQYIYYYSNPGGDTSSSASQKELLRIPLSGPTIGQAQLLYRDYAFNNTRNTNHHALISPDGQYIYYYSNPGGDTSSSASQKELLRIPLSGATVGQGQMLYRDYAFNNTRNINHQALMSRDGQYIYYYSNPGGDTSSSAKQKELLKIPLSGATVGQGQILYRDYEFNNTRNIDHHALFGLKLP